MAKAYKLNSTNKVIIIDDKNLSAADEQDIQRYVIAGYTIRHKSEKRAKKAKERAEKNNLTDKDILEALKADKEAEKEYKEIKKAKGFFAARSWYLKTYLTK